MKRRSVKTRLTKCLSLLLSVIMLCAMLPMTALTAHAEIISGTCGAQGNNLTWGLDVESGALYITGNGAMADDSPFVQHYDIIKTVFIGDGVTTIGAFAFERCNKITSVTISDSVYSIERNAFWYCTSLTDLTIPDSVRYIENSAFYGCTALSDLTIGNSIESIYSNAFSGCTSLTGVTIPANVSKIASGAFSECNNLQWVNILNSDCEIVEDVYDPPFPTSTHICCTEGSTAEAYAKKFDNPYGHVWGNYDIANGKKTGNCIFCSEKNEWDYYSGECGDQGDNVTWTLDTQTGEFTITGTGAIADYFPLVNARSYHPYCDKIKTIIIEDGVTKIGDCAFMFCSQTSVTIPDSVKEIGDKAFNSCSALSDVTIGDGVETIEFYAFFYCESLTGVTIPANVTLIRGGAFNHCNSLQWLNIQNPDCVIEGDYIDGDYKYPTVSSSTHICCAEGSTAEAFAKQYGNPYGHVGEWEVVDEPSCTEAGKKKLKEPCTICGEIAEEAIPALGHDYEEIDLDDATCIDDGAIYYQCKRCKAFYSVGIPALGHDFGAWTATADGEHHERACSKCSVIETEDHSYGEWTETADGEQHEHTCTICSYTEKEDHCDYVTEILKDATATATGKAGVTCPHCEHTALITLPKLSEDDYDVTDTATCTEAGNIVYTWKDKTYGTYSVSFDDSPALGHHYVETDLPDGRTEHKCSRCGDVYYTGEATVTKLIGDADGDGEISIYDVTRIQRVLASLETDADIVATARERGRTGSEALSIFDATNIQRYVAHYQDGNDIGKPRA